MVVDARLDINLSPMETKHEHTLQPRTESQGSSIKYAVRLTIIGFVAIIVVSYHMKIVDRHTNYVLPNTLSELFSKPLSGQHPEPYYEPYTAVGHIDYHQHFKLIELNKNASLQKREFKNYNFTFIFTGIHEDFARFTINEVYHDTTNNESEQVEPSQGGTSYRGEILGNSSLDLCSFTDFYNGSYIAVCPLHEKCAEISFKVNFVNYDAFQVLRLKPLATVIHSEKVCQADEYQVSGSQHTLVDYYPLQTNIGRGYWRYYKKNGQDEYLFQERGRLMKQWNKEQVLSCFHAYDSFTFVGASHLRYFSAHIINKAGRFPEGTVPKFEHYAITNYTLHIARYGSDVIKSLLAMSKEEGVKTEKDIVFVQHGGWDSLSRGLEANLKVVDDVYNTIKFLQNDTIWKNARFVLLTTVPYPSHYTVSQNRGYRNNHKIAGMVYHQLLKYRDSNIEILDTMKTLLPLDSRNVCGCHYLCFKDARHIFFGDGQIYPTLALELVCPNAKGSESVS